MSVNPALIKYIPLESIKSEQVQPKKLKAACQNEAKSCDLNNSPASLYNRVNFKGLEIKGKETKAVVFTDNLDYKAYRQIQELCNHPAFRDASIRIMPDVHTGKASITGLSATVDEANGVIPNIIGGDMGCGMLCIKLDIKADSIDFEALDEVVKECTSDKHIRTPRQVHVPDSFIKASETLCKKVLKESTDSCIGRLGTLGGGNHFVEIDKDDAGDYYLLIHSGSRNFGQKIAKHYQEMANQQNPYKIKDMSYLTGSELKEYLAAMKIARNYSRINRRIIADDIMQKMGWKEVSSFESVHNYISDDKIMRKGAISAAEGEKVIIPLNMKDGALIATGKGNSEWNKTSPHGAGRKFSRSEAGRILDMNEYAESMEGIYSSCVTPSKIQESPQAYKDPLEIINSISDTVEIQGTIKPIYNYKV